MNNFYVKAEDGKYIPIELNSILNSDLNNSLVIVKVGTDENPTSLEDLEATEKSFRAAEILGNIDVSIILTPYQIDIGVVREEDLEDKKLYLQITSGDNIEMLEKSIKQMYKMIKDKFDITILPTPLTVRDYNRVKDVLKRCQIRKDRRGRARG